MAIFVAVSCPVKAQHVAKVYSAYEAGDYATDLQEWRPFAEQGNSSAQLSLGWIYFLGEGLPQDYNEAVKWFRKAAKQGDAEAQRVLGVMYINGHGVLQDYEEAVRWYREAAEQGDAMAQGILGVLYINGLGVLQDNILAHMWYNIASANGDESGAENRDKIAKLMTPQDISKAQAMAQDCMNSNYQNCGD